MGCLIIGNHTQGLGIVRSLYTNGLNIHLVNDRIFSLSRFSKYLGRYHFLERDTLKNIHQPENADRLLNFIQQIIPKDAGWPVFCVNEDIVHFLHQQRLSFGGRLTVPANPIMDIIDKFRFAREMENIGIQTPKTHLLSSFDETLLKKGAYLCKGRIGNKFRTHYNFKGKLIENREHLKSLKRADSETISNDEIIVQEKISHNSEVLSCCGFSIEGKLYRHFQYVKLRQHPDEFGTGTFLKSIWNPYILEQTLKIIKHFGFTGIFEIEFLRKSEQYTIIEMNPRTWKSIHFAMLCGQNMCAAYAQYIRNGTIPKPKLDFSVDKTWVDLGTDIPILLKSLQWRHPGYGRDTYFCILNKKDPLPFLAEIVLAPLIILGI